MFSLQSFGLPLSDSVRAPSLAIAMRTSIRTLSTWRDWHRRLAIAARSNRAEHTVLFVNISHVKRIRSSFWDSDPMFECMHETALSSRFT